jgi:uncharacterized coiled-coil protein SlyX
MEKAKPTAVDMTPDKDEIITALNEIIREQQDKIESLEREIESIYEDMAGENI